MWDLTYVGGLWLIAFACIVFMGMTAFLYWRLNPATWEVKP